MPVPKVIAHRGYQRRYPENSMSALRAAVDCGAKFLEFDVHLSADHVPVLLHDDTLARLCGAPRSIHEITSRELQQYSAAEPDRLGNQFAQEPIATLKQCCELLATRPDVGAFVEVKVSATRQFGDPLVTTQVLNVLQPVIGQCTIISFSTELLQEVRRQSNCAIGPVVRRWPERSVLARFDEPPQVLFCDLQGLPPSGDLALDGTELAVFEVADARTALELARRGVDAVETFAVCEMLAELKQLSLYQT